MSDKTDIQEKQMKAYIAKEVAAISEEEERLPDVPESGAKPLRKPRSARKKRGGGLAGRFPSLPRFSDPGQQKAAGNIVKFLAALLIVTIIARGTSGATLARVDVTAPSRAEIVSAVTGTATVSARDTLDITVPEGLTVSEMLVGAGQTVSVGDIIARFDPDEVRDKLIRETASLDKLYLDLDKLERGETTDDSSLASSLRSLTRTQEDYNATKAQGEADIAAALKTLEEALAKTMDYPDTTQLNSAYRSYQRALEDYNATKAQNDAGFAASLAAYNTARAAETTALENYEAAKGTAGEDAARSAYESVVANTAAKKAAYDADKKVADSANATAYRKVEDAWDSYVKAENDYSKSYDQNASSLADEISRAREAYTSAQSKAADNLQSAQRKLEDAEISYAKAQADYEKSKQQTADTAEQNRINAATMRLDIEDQKAVVDQLQLLSQNNCTLYANTEGTVSSTVAEGSVTGKTPLVSFLDGAKGFEASLQISKSDAEKLTVGDECEVTTGGGSMYYNPTVTGTVSLISSPDENDKVTVTIRLPGSDWTNGRRVEVQAVQSRDTYDTCVPLNALHSDNSGYYLLVVVQTSTVLGVENTVTRVPVTVNASDSDMAAVRGSIDRSSAVITGSSKSVEAGDRVRVNS